jgi:LacI family transcriptional regulator
MGKVTIEDISRHTGLSRGTVSRALNNKPDISAQTKQRVLDACQELRYVPSHAARALATGRRYAIAVVVGDLRSAFAASYVRGVVARAARERYAVNVAELAADPQSAIETLCTLANERVDGLLLGTPLAQDVVAQLRAALEARPMVACDPGAGSTCDSFAPDYVEAGRLIARHLLRDGATDVLYVHQAGTPEAEQRLAGFREVCREKQVDADSATLRLNLGDGLAAVSARLGALRAVIGSDDFLAVDLMLLALAAGRHPGRDIAIAGQGNEALGARLTPGLTTVDYCGEEIGRRAVETVLQRITKTRQDAPQQTLVPPVLVVRESTRLS